MKPHTREDALPIITLRVPGMWKHWKELAKKLPEGYRIERDKFITPTGRRLGWTAVPADRAFPHIFQVACRPPVPAPIRRALERYRVNACLLAPGGSVAAAQDILLAAAALVRAGGIGVFVDNCPRAHVGAEWLQLTTRRAEREALLDAFLSVVIIQEIAFSSGMQVLGQRDACMPAAVGSDAFDEFLFTSSSGEVAHSDGDVFRDTAGRRFQLHAIQDLRLPPSHPIHNPYGLWALEPLAALAEG